MFSPPTAHTSSVWRTLSDSLRKPKSEWASETKASPKWWDETDPTASVSASRQQYNQTGSSECMCCLNSVFVSLFRTMQISSTLTCGRPGSRGVVCLHPRRARLPSSLKARPSCWTPTPQCWKCSLLKVQIWLFRGYLWWYRDVFCFFLDWLISDFYLFLFLRSEIYFTQCFRCKVFRITREVVDF